MKVIIVGAGIYGLSTAVQLVLRGHEVEIIDRGAIPNALASSFDYHRLIRHAYGPQTGYASLIPDSFKAWERLWQLLGESFYIETGALALGKKNDPWISLSRSSLVKMQIDCEDWNADQAGVRVPWLRVGSNEDLLFCASGGILRSSLLLLAMSDFLRSKGVIFHENVTIDQMDASDGLVVDQSKNRYGGDHVVSALGAGHGILFRGEIRPFRQVYALYEGVGGLATVESGCPMILDISEGAGFYYVPGSKHFPAKIGDHISRLEGLPYGSRKVQEEEISHLLGVIHSRVGRPEGPSNRDNGASFVASEPTLGKPSSYGLCFYESTADHVIQLQTSGRCTRVFGGSGHGFKFGALFGESIAEFISGDRSFGSAQKVVQGQGMP